MIKNDHYRQSLVPFLETYLSYDLSASSYVYEVIRRILNFFFYKEIYTHKKKSIKNK